jgi:RNA polymerase sigma factor (TIGR02999 family)
MDSPREVSRILEAMRRGEPDAAQRLIPLVYDELHRLAACAMAREKPGQTLQTTALVHEAYLRLFADTEPQWENRRHFFAAAAEAMRHILVDSARSKARLKRGGNLNRVSFEDAEDWASCTVDDLLDLDDALSALAAEAPEKAEVVKLRYFAGLSHEDIAQCLGISRATAERHWAYARAWLYDRLRGGGPRGPAAHDLTSKNC